MQNILENLNIFRGWIVHMMANASWRAEPQAEIVLVVSTWYIVVIFLLMFIHSKLLSKQKHVHENLVLLYDTIRYQVARAQYGNPIIQDNKGINLVIQEDHKNYLKNATTIQEEILSIEQKLWQQIITTNQREIIKQETNKKNRLTILVKIIGRITTILTVGIYRLFW